MRPRRSIGGPLVLIAIGCLFLLHTLTPSFDVADVIARYWPYFLIFWGVVQLIEIAVRAMRGAPVPVNGISGGGWFLVVLICFVGLMMFEFHRPDTWWRRAGFQPGIEMFGEEHSYSISPLHKTVGTAPHIVIESFRGNARITGGDGTDLQLSGHKTVRAFDQSAADRTNRQTPVDIVQDGNTVVIRCNQSKANSRTRVATDLDIAIPKGSSLEVTGTSGDFNISSISGDLDVNSDNAGIRVQDAGGNVRIDTRHSDLVRCTNVHGTIDIRGRGTDVELGQISGAVTLRGDYSGTVAIRNVQKTVRLESMRTKFEAQQVPGEIRMDRGMLNAENIIGPVSLTTRSTDVALTEFTDGLELTVADRGDVELRPSRLPLGKMVVHTRSGNIQLTLPPDAQFALNARTDHGDVNNQFGSALKEEDRGRGAWLEGSNGSGPDLNLMTGRGTITVRKGTTEAISPPASKPQTPETSL